MAAAEAAAPTGTTQADAVATNIAWPSGAPEVHCHPGGVAAEVLSHCFALRKPFRPSVWALNGHAQSFLGVLRTMTLRGSYMRQLVLASDGGTLGLDWWDTPQLRSTPPDAPVLLLIHGINGGSHEGYVKWAAAAAAAKGWRAVALNLRGMAPLLLVLA